MLIEIENDPRPYPWGSTSAISSFLGRPASGGPEAELWLGSHPGSPSRVIDPTQADGHGELAGWIELPFLLKVLAASSPLSLQAHPSASQARAGFDRENALGIPLDARHRNYKDSSAKPEMIVAVNDGFEALCGFRDPRDAYKVFARIAHQGEGPAFQRVLALLEGPDPVRTTFEWLVGEQRGEAAVLDNLCSAAAAAEGTSDDIAEFALVRRLAAIYPGDPGVAISVLLNHVTLAAGQALWLPAGNIHAYLGGLGIELMAPSDNVLRGGLTTKHIDVPELLAILDFASIAVPYLQPQHPAPGVSVYAPAGSDLALAWISSAVTLRPGSDAIVLAVTDGVVISGNTSTIALNRGHAVLVTGDEGDLTVSGGGQCVVAATALAI